MTTSELLAEITAFLDETGMGASYFGRLAAGNSELVSRLQAGKTVTLATAETVHTFIAKRRKESAQKQPTSGTASGEAA